MRRTRNRRSAAAAALIALALGGAVALPTASAMAESVRHNDQDTGASEMVRRGSTGFRVLQVQYVLRSQGYSIAADGRFGPATERAVKAFQGSRGLQADGIVGPKTSAALGLSTAASTPATPTTTTAPPATSNGAAYQHPRSAVERWHDEAVAAGWPESDWERLSCIINRESGGIPTARNSKSGAAGLLQIMWSAHSSWTGTTYDQLFDGPTNLRIGRELYLRSGGWGPWKSVTKAC